MGTPIRDYKNRPQNIPNWGHHEECELGTLVGQPMEDHNVGPNQVPQLGTQQVLGIPMSDPNCSLQSWTRGPQQVQATPKVWRTIKTSQIIFQLEIQFFQIQFTYHFSHKNDASTTYSKTVKNGGLTPWLACLPLPLCNY